MHPLSGELYTLKDSEIEEKIQSLTKKYFMTPNIDLKTQISALLDDYNQELNKRRQESLKKLMDSRDKRLDNLVKVN